MYYRLHRTPHTNNIQAARGNNVRTLEYLSALGKYPRTLSPVQYFHFRVPTIPGGGQPDVDPRTLFSFP